MRAHTHLCVHAWTRVPYVCVCVWGGGGAHGSRCVLVCVCQDVCVYVCVCVQEKEHVGFDAVELEQLRLLEGYDGENSSEGEDDDVTVQVVGAGPWGGCPVGGVVGGRW
jgi:hypothetical protein